MKLPLNQTDVGYLPSCLVTSAMLVTSVGESYGIILPNHASGSDQSQNRNLELTEINGFGAIVEKWFLGTIEMTWEVIITSK